MGTFKSEWFDGSTPEMIIIELVEKQTVTSCVPLFSFSALFVIVYFSIVYFSIPPFYLLAFPFLSSPFSFFLFFSFFDQPEKTDLDVLSAFAPRPLAKLS